MSRKGVSLAATLRKATGAATEGNAKCLMQFVRPAAIIVRFRSSQEMTVLFIAGIVFQVRDSNTNTNTPSGVFF